MGEEGTSGSGVRNQLQSLLSGKCRWTEHSWRMSGKWEKAGTGPVEVVTEVTVLRRPIVTELNVMEKKDIAIVNVLVIAALHSPKQCISGGRCTLFSASDLK